MSDNSVNSATNISLFSNFAGLGSDQPPKYFTRSRFNPRPNLRFTKITRILLFSKSGIGGSGDYRM